VDFEDVADGVFMNVYVAGVRWLGDPISNVKQKEVKFVNDPSLAFAGSRAAYVWTDQPEQRGQIMLQRRYDAPHVRAEDVVAEFVYRPTALNGPAVDLDQFAIFSTLGYRGGQGGIVLYASGKASTGTYDIDVEDAAGEDDRKRIATGLSQSEWRRFILHKHADRGTVELWIGPPDNETRVGEFEDIDPDRDWGRAHFGDLSDSEAIGSGYWDDVRIGRPLEPGGAVAPPEMFRDVGADLPKLKFPVVVGKERQLFVDDLLIQSQRGLTRTLHPAQKHAGNPLMTPDRPWETQAKSILPLSVCRDPETKQFRMWYGIWGKQIEKPTFEGYATSSDGIAWEKPNLGLYEFNGSTDNNIVREGRMFRVVPDPNESDPAKRYKAAIRDAGCIASYSPDGLRWTQTAPILDQALDASSVHWDPADKKWIASCKIFWNGQRARGYAESKDFENWTDTYFMLAVDERDGPEDQLYAMHISRYPSSYLGLLKIYHLDTDRCDIQLAFSRNARHWERPDRAPFIPNGSEKGAWDYGNLDDCSGNPIVMDDHLRFYYSGRSTLHNELPNDGAMGLATLRLDGFMSMDAGAEGGVLVTRPVKLRGNALYVNADVKAGGEIRVELLEDKVRDTSTDEADVPIFPFLKNNCAPIKTDDVRHVVRWNNSSSLESLDGRPVRLRFHMKDAQLYSFWTE
jgi:hypothetical protein